MVLLKCLTCMCVNCVIDDVKLPFVHEFIRGCVPIGVAHAMMRGFARRRFDESICVVLGCQAVRPFDSTRIHCSVDVSKTDQGFTPPRNDDATANYSAQKGW
jgi:hypothetical protein